MSIWDNLLCTDEDVAKDTVADYPQIVPRSNMVAFGKDGQIVTASAPWDLVSATVDFEARGVEPGHVVNVTCTAGNRPNDLLAIESVAGKTLTTRRIGKGAGFGQPPGFEFAAFAGLWFEVASCEAQIANWTNKIREWLRITDTPVSELKAGSRSETFEQACADLTLFQLYRDKSKEAGPQLGGAGVAASEYGWKSKQHYDLVMKPKDGLLAILFETYGPSPGALRKARVGQLARPQPYPPDPYGPPRPYAPSDWGDASRPPGWAGYGA